MRSTVRFAMRELAALGVGSLLPDLPGQNESLIPTEDASLTLWRSTLRAIAEHEGRPIVTAAIRGGALLDDAVPAVGAWRLGAVRGSSLLKTMVTARIASDREAGINISRDELLTNALNEPIQLAGNVISARMIRELNAAEPNVITQVRDLRVGEGDGQIKGTPLWLRAEPDTDANMARAIAKDIHEWMEKCGVI